ncbi:MAG: isomerase [Desulfobulbaceae bacterium A2]|nr:MAG: isomerase [Desulfobulbaceae bacterium A2]
MKIPLYQVDAFTERVFAGNPAAVCPLDSWLPDETLQAITAENNLSDTAFFVPGERGFHLRWFTPAAEVDLCGHATLATAHVLFEHLGHATPQVVFTTRSGVLTVERQGRQLMMNFPSQVPQPCASVPAALAEALGQWPLELLAADDYLVLLESEEAVRGLTPDMERLRTLDRRGVCVTARGTAVDFVSRFFAPKLGVPEDPVTGSAYCELTPYWSARLGKDELRARQVSHRGGDLLCRLQGDRVLLFGSAVTYMRGEIELAP